ncbi:MAG: hypothetical protein AAGF89_09335, partial [Bacteroidota bacterium]
MVKIFLRIALALVLAIIAFAFYLAAASQEVPAGFSTNKGQVGLLNMEEDFVIAFGSCNNQRRAQDYWPVIGEKKPDVWLWLGDNIYSDTDDMQQMAAD